MVSVHGRLTEVWGALTVYANQYATHIARWHTIIGAARLKYESFFHGRLAELAYMPAQEAV